MIEYYGSFTNFPDVTSGTYNGKDVRRIDFYANSGAAMGLMMEITYTNGTKSGQLMTLNEELKIVFGAIDKVLKLYNIPISKPPIPNMIYIKSATDRTLMLS